MQKNNNLNSNNVPVGKITDCHGVKGQVKILSFCSPESSIFSLAEIFIAGKEVKITKTGINKDRFIASVDGVNSRNDAELLKGLEIFTPRDKFPSLHDEDEFYIHDLIGMEVCDGGGEMVGKVISVQNFGSEDMIEIKRTNGKITLLDFTKENFPIIDIKSNRIII